MILPEMVGSWGCGFQWEGVMGNHLLPRAPSQAQPTGLADGPASGSHPTLRTGLFALPQDSNIKRKEGMSRPDLEQK